MIGSFDIWAAGLRNKLALSDEHLFESFAEHVFPYGGVVVQTCSAAPGNCRGACTALHTRPASYEVA
jgi:hypothetical protein